MPPDPLLTLDLDPDILPAPARLACGHPACALVTCPGLPPYCAWCAAAMRQQALAVSRPVGNERGSLTMGLLWALPLGALGWWLFIYIPQWAHGVVSQMSLRGAP